MLIEIFVNTLSPFMAQISHKTINYRGINLYSTIIAMDRRGLSNMRKCIGL